MSNHTGRSYTRLPAEQRHHPDYRDGWSVTVLDREGLLLARFYGTTERIATARAKEAFP